MAHKEEQAEEVEALRSIFEEEFSDSIMLKFTLPEDYPDVGPVIEIPMRTQILPHNKVFLLLQHLSTVVKDYLGMVMVFSIVDAAKSWLADDTNMAGLIDDSYEGPLPEQEENGIDISLDSVKLTEAKITGGRWNFVIGLVGKPSAGKSTFFNAATQYDMAKTGAHPFTTIEPNIGKAFYTIPCPCAQLEERCNAAHGHNHSGERFVPVLLKDVAGLVPGACQGKGRGNRFLNDLLDADVLMHILDVSGCTDASGQPTEGYDPVVDIEWLQQELHQWIYNNIMEKWDMIRKRPVRLVDMFTGYHANKSTIHTAMQNAGVGEKELARLPTWDESVLPKIVSSFLSLRFPIFIVMNKADTQNAEYNIKSSGNSR